MSTETAIPRRIISSPEVAKTPGFFSQAVRAGNVIYVSGQVAYDKHGNLVGKGDMAAQMRQVIENIRSVLSTESATLEDIVKVTMYVTDMSMAPLARAVRMEFFERNPPASTGIEVSGLAAPELLVEMDAVAILK